jgi:uncharacterized protein YbaP (TraB family)
MISPKRVSALLLLCFTCLAAAPASRAEQQADGSVMEEVEVTGERAGPRLWRVSNGDHVVWLLGTLDPLPKQMTWRSRELESVLDEVNQVLPTEPDVDVKAGPITLMRLYFQWRRVQKIPGEASLKDWLSPQLYARWAALKTRYDVRDRDIDRQLPVLAGARLYRRALDVSKLAPGTNIEKTVLKLARKHHVKIKQTPLKVEDPRNLVTQLSEIPREAQIACLEAIVERLEKDIDTIKAQANAWALGDVETLRALPYPREIQACTSALETSGNMKALIDGANRGWDSALEDALTTNQPTLGVKPIYELLKPGGTLAALRAKGYRVEGP